MPIENLGVINKCISVICLKIKTYPLLISLYPKYRTNYHCSYYKGTKCNQVKINIEPYTESTNDIPIIQNSYICKDIKAQAKVREIKEKNVEEEQEISKPTKAAPSEQAAWDNNTVFE